MISFLTVAICYSDLKTAAVYYDSVIPYLSTYNITVNPMALMAINDRFQRLGFERKGFLDDNGGVCEREILKSILPKELVDGEQISSDYTKYSEHICSLLTYGVMDSLLGKKVSFNSQKYKKIQSGMLRYNSKLVKKCIHYTPSQFGESGSKSDLNTEREHYICSISDLDLIDLGDVEWPKIIEFRKDKKSLQIQRDFIHLMYKDYSGKNSSFIQDEVCKIKDEYETVKRKWGWRMLKDNILFQIPCSSPLVISLCSGKQNQLEILAGIIAAVWPIGVAISKELVQTIKYNPSDIVSIVRQINKKLH